MDSTATENAVTDEMASNAANKQDSQEDDLDDQMTEANLSVEQLLVTQPKTHIDTPRPKATNTDKQPETSAARINKRRMTMASGLTTPHTSTPLPRVSEKKRRMSDRECETNTSTSVRNRSKKTVDASVSTAAKRIRLDENSLTENSSSPSKPKAKSKKSLESTGLFRFKILPSPSHDKKSKNRRITQFFIQKPVPECEICAVVLRSQKEKDFHLIIHEKKRCPKCAMSIEKDDSSAVEKHIISCLFLSNKLSNDMLTHLFKAKVGVSRLTPNKIKEIQEKLSTTKPSVKIETAKSSDKIETVPTPQNEKQSDETVHTPDQEQRASKPEQPPGADNAVVSDTQKTGKTKN